MNLITALAVATVLVVFGAQNTQSVTFHFFMFDLGPAPIVFAVFVAAFLGAAVGWLFSVPGSIRGDRSRRHLEQEVTVAHQQNVEVRSELEEMRERSRPPESPPLPRT